MTGFYNYEPANLDVNALAKGRRGYVSVVGGAPGHFWPEHLENLEFLFSTQLVGQYRTPLERTFPALKNSVGLL